MKKNKILLSLCLSLCVLSGCVEESNVNAPKLIGTAVSTDTPSVDTELSDNTSSEDMEESVVDTISEKTSEESVVTDSSSSDDTDSDVTVVDVGDNTILTDSFEDVADFFFKELDSTPKFTDKEKEDLGIEKYSDVDSLGRCVSVFANLSKDNLTSSEVENEDSATPTGWQDNSIYVKYGLLSLRTSGNNSTGSNLITVTKDCYNNAIKLYMNKVVDYLKETDNHVLFRATPVFDGDCLLPSTIKLEALSLEDDGEGLCFSVECYNIALNYFIDYSTGVANFVENTLTSSTTLEDNNSESAYFIVDKSSDTFHKEDCKVVKNVLDKEKFEMLASYDEMLDLKYKPCRHCLK